jgi:hypothetical protein
MRTRFLTLFVFNLFALPLFAQTGFSIDIEPISIPNAPGIHSFAYGITSDGKWVVLGGRIDGLHQRQPFAAFLEQDNNKSVYVIDPVNAQVWSSNLDVLPTSQFEQLQSTNQNFEQRNGTLYLIGGYGRSNTANDHITFDGLLAVDVDGLANAVMNSAAINGYFREIHDPIFKVTGGQLGYLDSTFYLVGGHLFDGRYNPQGPDHGPGFIQEYTNEIRSFKLFDDGSAMTITDYEALNDTVNLHRRDYNMVEQIFTDGSYGYTAFSGVFDYNNMPYLNVVDVFPGSYQVNNSFNQLLSQYHSPKMPIYDTVSNHMYTFFFGGMSQFQLDAQGNLVEDVDVPFVKTISKVVRSGDGSMIESKLSYLEMPALLGAGAEFIPTDEYRYSNNVINLSSVPFQRTLVGYIYGGIESSGENIFFINDGTLSHASTTVFGVYIDKSITNLPEIEVDGKSVFDVHLHPNPANKKVNLTFFASSLDTIEISVIGSDGKLVHLESYAPLQTGTQELKISVSELSSGPYFLKVSNGAFSHEEQFIKR